MFYNILVETFQQNEGLFSDVKAIVDCPININLDDLVRACKNEGPKQIMDYLLLPGSDLEVHSEDGAQPPREPLGFKEKLEKEPDEGADLPALPKRPARKRRASVGSTRPIQGELGYGGLVIERATPKGRIEHPNLSLPKPGEPTAEGDIQLRRLGTQIQLRIQGHFFAKEAAPARRVERRSTISFDSMAQLGRKFTSMSTSDLEQILKENQDIEDEAQRIYMSRLVRMGLFLGDLWPSFSRKVSMKHDPDKISLIQIPRPFIVPGGRFIESYYWDSFWIILGLLATGHIQAAKDIILNFLFSIERYGFVPNGFRKYYLDRSQPPLLSCMLRAYYHKTGDKDFIARALPILEHERDFFMDKARGHAVTLRIPVDAYSSKHVTLNRYYSCEPTPRPESYRIDKIMGSCYERMNGAAENIVELYRSIRAAAESGWDFSSRWLRPVVEGQGESYINYTTSVNRSCLVDIDTVNIIPCDLNAFLYCVELDIAYFAGELSMPKVQSRYKALSEQRRDAMLDVLWDKKEQRWMDYDMKKKCLSKVISAASFVPLWAGVNREEMSEERRVDLASKLAPLERRYGIAATNVMAGLQWDMPNVWAPNHHMATEFMAGGRFWSFHKELNENAGPATTIAIDWASRFVNTALDRFETYGTFSEKYDCERLGKTGHDGEYITQDGFGWTNGVILDFLENFHRHLKARTLQRTEVRNRSAW